MKLIEEEKWKKKKVNHFVNIKKKKNEKNNISSNHKKYQSKCFIANLSPSQLRLF